MRVCLKEYKDAELFTVMTRFPSHCRKNDTYENTQPEIEHCSDGIAPQPNTAVETAGQKLIVPVVVSGIAKVRFCALPAADVCLPQ
ncbi:MAG: hypothetical protein V8Q82_07350 [Christensenellales bacterium]